MWHLSLFKASRTQEKQLRFLKRTMKGQNGWKQPLPSVCQRGNYSGGKLVCLFRRCRKKTPLQGHSKKDTGYHPLKQGTTPKEHRVGFGLPLL